MVHSKLAAVYSVTLGLVNICMKLTLYVVCFLFILSDYSAAKNKLSQDSSNQSPAGHTNSYSFIVWGHPMGAKDGDLPLHLEDFSDLVRELKPNFVVITGDMIQGRLRRIEEQKKRRLLQSDWDFFDECVEQLRIPIYRLPGNHDVSNIIASDIYAKRYPQPPYSFSYKGSRFILLDSVGVKQRPNNIGSCWWCAQPFDEEQISFIKNEISDQNKYNHLFFFMHHASPWSESESFWWDHVHPLLVNGKTRAVFSGDNPSKMKFAHVEQDGIHYLLNNSFPTKTLKRIKRRWPNWTETSHRQMDNIQFVQVNGSEVKYKTHVIGEMSTESLSWRFYEKVDKFFITWEHSLVNKLKTNIFYNLRSIILVLTIWGGVCFLFGILLIPLLKRFMNK